MGPGRAAPSCSAAPRREAPAPDEAATALRAASTTRAEISRAFVDGRKEF